MRREPDHVTEGRISGKVVMLLLSSAVPCVTYAHEREREKVGKYKRVYYDKN